MTNEAAANVVRCQKSIKEARVVKRISLRKAALCIGISTDRMEYLENNPDKIPLNLGMSLARLYGVTVDELNFMP